MSGKGSESSRGRQRASTTRSARPSAREPSFLDTLTNIIWYLPSKMGLTDSSSHTRDESTSRMEVRDSVSTARDSNSFSHRRSLSPLRGTQPDHLLVSVKLARTYWLDPRKQELIKKLQRRIRMFLARQRTLRERRARLIEERVANFRTLRRSMEACRPDHDRRTQRFDGVFGALLD